MCENQIKTICCGTVEKIGLVAGNIFELVLHIKNTDPASLPRSGQFYMLRHKPSEILLSRPISIFCSRNSEDGLELSFLIMQKGSGTKELTGCRTGDSVEVMGPLGNSFEDFHSPGKKIAIVGGGIGVAPVAGFAEKLEAGSYDFFASFKSGSYGTDHLKPAELFISTDDGSVGTKGMLPVILNESVLKQKDYSAVYACGPEPMLAYVQDLCRTCGIPCFLSMEARMACGVGACLGCTIETTLGNRRCCKDGPVFPGEILLFKPRKPARFPLSPADSSNSPAGTDCPDLSVNIAGVSFANPVIAASGTFGYGAEYSQLVDVDSLGGICSKGLTLQPKAGNPGQRLVENAGGLMNSIGLENPGIAHFIEHELPSMLRYKAVTIANLSGSSKETYVEGAKLLDATDVPMIELNISCPNVKAGGMAFGLDPVAAGDITASVRAVTKKPLMVKLSPNAPDIVAIADAVRRAGADAISLVNTFQGLAVDIEKGETVFANIKAGYSGPAVKPLALRMVYDVCSYMKKLPLSEQIPVVGLGGISTWQDAVEFIMCGAAAVQVGTATFANPSAMEEIVSGISTFLKRKGCTCLDQIRGCALPE